MPPPQVSVVTVQAKDAPLTFEYTGQTAGSRETEVRARVGGILQRRLFEEGATVKAGAALFQIDPANLQTTVASTEAAIGVAEARYNQAKRDNARLVPLIAEKAISQKEFDDSKSALETAEATLRQVRAQAAEAKLNLGYTRVVAPIGGVTGVAAKADGSLVNSTDMLTTIVQVNPIYVNFSVSEGDMLKLNKQIAAGQVAVPGGKSANGSAGFAVSVKLADGSTWPKQGKLNFTSEKLNPTTGSYDARAEIPNPDGALRPGQFVRVVLGGASRTQSITVPQRAILDGPMGKMVFKVSKWPENLKASRAGKLMMWGLGLSAATPDGAGIFALGYGKAIGNGLNHPRFRNAEFDAIYQKLQLLPDGPERFDLMQRAAKIMVAYMPVKFSGHRYITDMAQPWVIGYRRNPLVRDFWKYVDIDTKSFKAW